MTESSKPPSGRRMKAQAPPPPQTPHPAPRNILRDTVPDEGEMSALDTKGSVLRPTVDLQLTLPQGYQTYVTEDGSKALMDLLVELCSRYHLNPALHTLELLSPVGHPLGFKPNVLLGSLDVACVLIKERVWEEKVVRRPAPKLPEKTVRLMVNYHSSQKAVVRVNPLVPLQSLIPVICDKCEFDPRHVLLLKDSISHHELPLDKSLTQLGIKELYILDHSPVLQPKMASAPALNYSDSISSSTTSLGRVEKKGLLGIFQFGRRKSKTDTTSMDMSDSTDKIMQNTETHSNGLSKVTESHSIADRPNTLGQSQSVMNMSKMSPKFDIKKRRAPAPPGSLTSTIGDNSFEKYQMGLGSESQQRKRKAPAPPPTPVFITPGPDDTSNSATPSSDKHATKVSNPTFHPALSTPVLATAVVTQTVEPKPLQMAVQPPSVCAAAPIPSSPTPSSSTTDSLAVQDSSSELSHSLDDSDLDPDQSDSHCSTLSSSSASRSVQVQPTTKRLSSRMEEANKASSMAAKLNQEETSTCVSRSEIETTTNLKLDEVENNRHSAMGTTDQPAPPKPRRSLAQQPPQLSPPPTPSTPPLSSPYIEPTESNSPQRPRETKEAAPQSWLHSMQSSTACGHIPEPEIPEEETLSLDSSSVGSSLPDQGYAASEGMAEDRSGEAGGEGLLGPVRDNSSDSDEGCATWGSRQRHYSIKPQAKSGKLNGSDEENPEQTALLPQTFAKFEADLADNIDIVSAKKASYMSTDSNEVPVSLVDMYVPVTAIDEVLEDYGPNIVEYEAKLLNRTEPADRNGLHHAAELQNKNNNACTATDSSKSNIVNAKMPPEYEQRRKSVEEKSIDDKREEKVVETEINKIFISNKRLKEDKQRTLTAKSNFNKHVLLPASQRLVSPERDETQKVTGENISISSTSHSKITHCVTSRFGMKTFTVVPPKPCVMQAATEESATTLSAGAIKIDEQGNMVKVVIHGSKVSGSSESGTNSNKGSPLVERAKAFWGSNERQDNVFPHSQGLMDRAKESTEDTKITHTAGLETTVNRGNVEDLKKAQSTMNKPAERTSLKECLKKEVKEPMVAKHEQVEVISLSKPVQQQRDMPFLKPSRRTSSQYVASAINKYTPKTLAKPSASVKSLKSGQSIQVNPHQSSHTSLPHDKENDPGSKPPGPNRSTSYPDYVSESHRDFERTEDRERFGISVGSTKGSCKSLETANSKHIRSSCPTKINVTASDVRDINKCIQGSPVSSQSSHPLSSAKLLISPKTQGQTSSARDMTKADSNQRPDVKTEPSLGALDSSVVSGPPPLTLFGPIKKFRPVVCRSVEKDTSLHSSLMEAIQAGGGKERLKKIVTSGPSSMKKASYTEDENERSALLAAIRAQSNNARLKKTKSEAADELEKFRKAASEEERTADLSSPHSPTSITSNSPPVSTTPLPPPPLAPMVAPPAPPLLLLQGNNATMTHPSTNAPMNAALAREAMLEAIRSGSAAEKLKKVVVPRKTVQVNGRLGTIQPTSSTVPHQ